MTAPPATWPMPSCPARHPDQARRQADRPVARQARASFLLAVDDIRRRGCAAAGVRLTGTGLSAICRLDLYGAWRLLTAFEAPDRCILLLVAEHARTENPYHLIYDLGSLRRLLTWDRRVGTCSSPTCTKTRRT
jgi:hypothetical protein